MDTRLPESVRVDTLVDGVRYVLPRRQLGKARFAGLFLVLFGGFMVGFAVVWMSGPVRGFLETEGPFRWLLFAFAATGLIPLVFGLGFLGLGFATLLNVTHSEVEVTRGRLRAIERFGPLGFSRSRRIDAIERLVIGKALAELRDKRGRSVPIGAQLQVIRAEGDGIKPLKLAPGYARQLLQLLAQSLAEKIDAEAPDRLFERDRPSVEVETEQVESEREDVVPDQPGGSDAVLDRRADGITISIPPAGVRKGSKGLFGFSILWNGFMVVFTLILTISSVNGQSGDGEAVWLMFAFTAVFWAIGIAMLLAAINMGKRRAILDVVGETLLITRASLFGTKQREFRADSVDRIVAGPSGMEVNDVPVIELQVHPRGGKKVGMLSQRSDDELEWIAAVLRAELRVGD